MEKMFSSHNLFLILVCLLALTPLTVKAAWKADTPYAEDATQYYEVGDDCGYVMGNGARYPSVSLIYGQVRFTEVVNKHQGCVDSDGNFYSDSSRKSYANYVHTLSGIGGSSTTYTMDLAWSANSARNIVVDRTTGKWTCGAGSNCYARFTSPTLKAQPYVWFDWNCAAGSSCEGEVTNQYHVYTDMETGIVSGYAWSDEFGFISFTGDNGSNEITQELPPREIVAYVDVLTYDEDAGTWINPEDADYLNAPLADGFDYWKIRVQFEDSLTNEYLTEDDISSLEISESATSDSGIDLNQVEDSGDALLVSYENLYANCASDTAPCVEVENDGTSVSFNKYVYSAAPTSNVLGLDDDSDSAIEYYSDRSGCRWVYEDQWKEVDGSGSQPTCPLPLEGGTKHYDKDDVFSARESDRNKYEIEYLDISVNFTGIQDVEMYEWDDSATGGTALQSTSDDSWRYVPEEDSLNLKFRPRYQIENFAAFYDNAQHKEISDDSTKTMSLITEATVSKTSLAYRESGGSQSPAYDVRYQLDAESDAADPVLSDLYLLMDIEDPPDALPSRDVEGTHREESEAAGSPSTSYYAEYAMAYGQKCFGGASCPSATNSLSSPTAEQWVCDFVEDDFFQQNFGGPSCYYTEYLPHIDRHVDPPEAMLVVGAINSVIDDTALLDENYVSILGAAETIELRNKMYAQVARYTLGQNAGGGTLKGDGLQATGGILELMNGRLLYAEGDVTIEGCTSTGCTGINKTLVVKDGDIFINGDITGIRLGIVSFSSGKGGGDAWIRYDVNNLYTNMFLDGSLFSYNGYPPTTSYPTWYSDENRLEYLTNQLYLKGSLVSRNTVNGAEDPDASSAAWPIGDGTTSTSYEEAREYDLNLLRQYRLCFALDSSGGLTSTEEECSEGETLSEYGTANPDIYGSFIIEYHPASDLPIFNVESGLFR